MEGWEAYDFVCAFIELRLKVDYTQGHREEIDCIACPCKPSVKVDRIRHGMQEEQ